MSEATTMSPIGNTPADDTTATASAQAEAARLHDRLKRELSPEIWAAVYAYGEAKERGAEEVDHNTLYLAVEMIAAHFPGIAPAIRCMIQHGFDSDYGRGAECGVVAYSPEDRPGTAGTA